MKITASNWKETFPKAPMTFATFINGAYCEQKFMLKPGTNIQIRYVEPEDIIQTLQKRIKNQLNPGSVRSIQNTEKWNKMIQQAEQIKGKNE